MDFSSHHTELFYRPDAQFQEQQSHFFQNDWRVLEPVLSSCPSEFLPQEQFTNVPLNIGCNLVSPSYEGFPQPDAGFFTSFLTAIGQQQVQVSSCLENEVLAQEFSENNQFLVNDCLNDAGQLGGASCWNTGTNFVSAEFQAPFNFDRDAAVSSSVSSGELVINPIQAGLAASEEGGYGITTEGVGFIDNDEDELSKVENLSGKNPGNKKGKKGLPAKNLMAERRRRKKLNDNLFTLRSVVPKISKQMDRTSILGDAVSYVKELQQRIYSLKIENLYSELETPVANYAALEHHLPFQEETKPYLTLPTKVDVQTESGNSIVINMICEQRPGLLDSTMRALDGLGVVIQKGSISFVNGFKLEVQAEQQAADQVRPEEIRAVLLHTAGYHSQI